MISKITGGETTFLFEAKVLNKYNVKYYKCNDTGFIQTEDPFWLDEAYSAAIATLDIGLVLRNINLAKDVEKIINGFFDYKGRFLDYAGGYGMFTRIMRDRGFDFHHNDIYCENIFAKYFEQNDLAQGTRFDLITAFEVFEHLKDPNADIAGLFKSADNIIFSTEIVPEGKTINSTEDWWYFVPEIGQHIAFYTLDALQYIAKANGKHLYTNGHSLHIFTQNALPSDPFAPPARDPFLIRKIKKYLRKVQPTPDPHTTLLTQDVEYVKSKMFNS